MVNDIDIRTEILTLLALDEAIVASTILRSPEG